MTFGEWMREKRIAQGKTLEDVARATGVQRSAVSKWERNATTISIRYIRELCDILDVTPNMLIDAYYRYGEKSSE